MSTNNGGILSNGVSGQGFPSQVNGVQAIGVEGDFAVPGNPFSSVMAPNGQFVAGAQGAAVGAFAWVDSTNGVTIDNFGVGLPLGFIHRAQQGVFSSYATHASLVVLSGLPVVVMNTGDFYVRNSGLVAATPGMKAYALNSSGLVTFNVTATPPTGASAGAATLTSIISATTGGALPTTNTCTGSISGSTLTVTAMGSGSVIGSGVGQTITGTGIDPSETVTIVAQLTGTAGGIGTYQLSTIFGVAVTSTSFSLSGGGLTLTGANYKGVFAVGMTLTGTNIPAATTILAYGTATAGAAGTYLVSQPATVAATASTITASNASFLTVDATSTGTWGLNELLTGSSVAASQYLVANGVTNSNLTGLGGAGTYLTNLYQAAQLTAQTIGVQAGVETTWVATSSGAPGELVSFKNASNV